MIYVWDVPIIASVQDILDVLKAEVRSSGVDLLKHVKPTAGNIMVTCVNHTGKDGGQEKKPSLGILTEDTWRNEKLYKAGTCNCFTCGYTADLPEFVSKCFGYNDKGMMGYKWITENFVNLSVEKRSPLVLNMSREEAKPEPDNFISEEVLKSYRYTHSYMYERKLTDKVIDYFDVGWDKEKNALTFPVHDLQGRVALIQRRTIGFKMFINDEGADKGDFIYGLYQVYKNLHWIKEVTICESPIDALTCWTHRKAAVALMGANVTSAQIKLLRALPVRKYVVGLDNDKAGHDGTAKLKKHLSDIKLMYRLQFPDGVKDINAMDNDQLTNWITTLV